MRMNIKGEKVRGDIFTEPGFWLLNTAFLVGAAVLSYANIPEAAFFALCALLVIDYILGLATAICLGEKITSKKMGGGALAKLATMLVIYSFGLAANLQQGFDFQEYLSVIITIAAFSELYSIVSHLVCIKTGQRLPEWDAWSLLGRSIRKIVERLLGVESK